MKKIKILALTTAAVLGMNVVSFAADLPVDSYEKEIVSIYSLDGNNIPMEIDYSEFNAKLDGDFSGRLRLVKGEMKDDFTFYMIYKGTLTRE